MDKLLEDTCSLQNNVHSARNMKTLAKYVYELLVARANIREAIQIVTTRAIF